MQEKSGISTEQQCPLFFAWALTRGSPGAELELMIDHLAGRKALPIIALKRVAKLLLTLPQRATAPTVRAERGRRSPNEHREGERLVREAKATARGRQAASSLAPNPPMVTAGIVYKRL